MKRDKQFFRIVVNVLSALVAVLIMIAAVYYGSTPRQYDLHVGDISPYDIAAPRDIADEAETMRRALAEMSQVPNIMLRSEERSDASRERVRSLIVMVQEIRDALYREPVVEVLPPEGEGQGEEPGEPEETRDAEA